jgi:hypothetical protein
MIREHLKAALLFPIPGFEVNNYTYHDNERVMFVPCEIGLQFREFDSLNNCFGPHAHCCDAGVTQYLHCNKEYLFTTPLGKTIQLKVVNTTESSSSKGSLKRSANTELVPIEKTNPFAYNGTTMLHDMRHRLSDAFE